MASLLGLWTVVTGANSLHIQTCNPQPIKLSAKSYKAFSQKLYSLQPRAIELPADTYIVVGFSHWWKNPGVLRVTLLRGLPRTSRRHVPCYSHDAVIQLWSAYRPQNYQKINSKNYKNCCWTYLLIIFLFNFFIILSEATIQKEMTKWLHTSTRIRKIIQNSLHIFTF
jgi:hypothetical protein